mmetsp:Transcript_28578/g.21338  ORF Transcript_28578/g.21338 Transcript_28578/m.21338 type:complete len:87 (-) Transcript_28578:100-360(-)
MVGKTTNERFAKKASSSFVSSTLTSEDAQTMLSSHARESLIDSNQNPQIIEDIEKAKLKRSQTRKKKGCCGACCKFALERDILSQE